MGEEGVLLTKRRPFLSQALSNPTAREMWRHSFADAKRRKFKFDIFRVQVSASKIWNQIYKFYLKSTSNLNVKQ